MLTIDQILAVQPAAVEKVTVPEWGGEVFIRPLTAAEVARLYQALDTTEESTRPPLASLVTAFSLCDEAGKPLVVAGEEMALARKLGAQSYRAVKRVFRVASRLSGFIEEEPEKNSETSRS